MDLLSSRPAWSTYEDRVRSCLKQTSEIHPNSIFKCKGTAQEPMQVLYHRQGDLMINSVKEEDFGSLKLQVPFSVAPIPTSGALCVPSQSLSFLCSHKAAMEVSWIPFEKQLELCTALATQHKVSANLSSYTGW